VPADKYDIAMKDLENAPVAAKIAGSTKASSMRDVAKNGEGPEEAGLQYYLIGPGETLSEISVQLGVSIAKLKEINGIDNPRSIRAGQKILIPAEPAQTATK